MILTPIFASAQSNCRDQLSDSCKAYFDSLMANVVFKNQCKNDVYMRGQEEYSRWARWAYKKQDTVLLLMKRYTAEAEKATTYEAIQSALLKLISKLNDLWSILPTDYYTLHKNDEK